MEQKKKKKEESIAGNYAPGSRAGVIGVLYEEIRGENGRVSEEAFSFVVASLAPGTPKSMMNSYFNGLEQDPIGYISHA